jgi:carboxypeptidase C (cathepsin A)
LDRHIEVTPEHNGNLFFWHYQNQHIANRQRTVIWLNGGPGCSSEDGGLMEIGPYRLKDDKTLTLNDGSWHEFANLLFVDNPVGTGFSYVDTDSYVTELDQMADQFVTFLEKWFAIFPEYEQDDVRQHQRNERIIIFEADLSRSTLPESRTLDNISPISRSTCLNEIRSPALLTSGN